jgi:hypothetical protein
MNLSAIDEAGKLIEHVRLCQRRDGRESEKECGCAAQHQSRRNPMQFARPRLKSPPPIVFQDGVPAAGAVIRASHIIDLRNALNAAVFPNPVYAHPGLAIGDVVRAEDIQELRNYAR